MSEVIKYTTTDQGITSRILSFISNPYEFFFVIAKSTTWDSSWGQFVTEDNPPTPTRDLTTIPEVIVYKRPQYILPAIESTCSGDEALFCGNISSGSSGYRLINPRELIENGRYRVTPNYVYFSGEIDWKDYTEQSFRIVGLYNNVTLKTGIDPQRISYSESEIDNKGIIQWISYSTKIERIAYKTHNIQILMKL